MNKRRSVYNIATGVLGQLLTIALGAIIPRLFLTSFGSEYNGLLSSISQALVYLALLEAGVGGASLQALYGTIAKGDKQSTSAIVNATGHYYRKTGYFYAVAVTLLAIVFPFVTTSNIPPLNTTLIILLAGVPGVVSYIFQGKYNILLRAEGKNYILTVLSTSTLLLTSCCKITLLLIGCHIIFFQICCMCISLLQVLFVYAYIKRHYGWLDFSITPDFQAISQKNAVLVGQISDMVFRNSSTLILAICCDLKIVSVYAIFNLLFSMINTGLGHIAHGMTYLMGQTYNRDKALFLRYHDTYETYRMPLIYSLYMTALLFIIPFMRLYTAGITDANYLDYGVAVLFSVSALLSGSRIGEADLINYAQHFRKTQWRCVAEAGINLVVALLLTPFYGIYGVLIGTIVALLYRTNDMIIYANRRILGRSPWITYKRVLANAAVFILLYYLFHLVLWPTDSYLSIVLSAGATCVVSTLIFWGIASFVDRECFLYLRDALLRKYRLRAQVRG